MQAERAEKEKKKKEKQEAHLYTIIKVARDQDFSSQIGSTQFFDLVDHDKVQLWRCPVSVRTAYPVALPSMVAYQSHTYVCLANPI